MTSPDVSFTPLLRIGKNSVPSHISAYYTVVREGRMFVHNDEPEQGSGDRSQL